jgi:NADH dehydrogenase [ubiquinone] 1 alpha subcomplex assembly factor 5
VRTSIAGPARRTYASLSPYTPPPQSVYEVFDEPSKSRQKDRALLRLAEQAKSGPPSAEEGSEAKNPTAIVDYIREELAERLAERVEVRSTSIPNSRLRLSGDDEACRPLIVDTLGLENSPIDNPGTFRARWPAHKDPAGDFGRRIGRWRQEEVAGSRGQW